jgi:hypothetical protein
MKASTLLFFLATFSQLCLAQSVRLMKTEQEGDNVIIWYDLEGTADEQRYKVEIYGSHNDFQYPLSFTSGDVGPNIKPGESKKIVWNAKAELNRFEGAVEFRITVILQYSPLTDLTVLGGRRFVRGKEYQVTWMGGEPDDLLNLELFRKGRRTYRIPDIKNTGTYKWIIPANVKPSNWYRFSLTVVDNPSTGTTSETFKIKRKFPRGLIVIPGIIVTGAVGYLIYNNLGKEEPLPMPPGSPEN